MPKSLLVCSQSRWELTPIWCKNISVVLMCLRLFQSISIQPISLFIMELAMMRMAIFERNDLLQIYNFYNHYCIYQLMKFTNCFLIFCLFVAFIGCFLIKMIFQLKNDYFFEILLIIEQKSYQKFFRGKRSLAATANFCIRIFLNIEHFSHHFRYIIND